MEGEEYYKNLLKGSHIPERMHGEIIEYIVNHIPPGDFLTAVISNDLVEAFDRADDENTIILKRYVYWFHNCAPTNCWGTKEYMNYWLNQRKRLRDKIIEILAQSLSNNIKYEHTADQILSITSRVRCSECGGTGHTIFSTRSKWRNNCLSCKSGWIYPDFQKMYEALERISKLEIDLFDGKYGGKGQAVRALEDAVYRACEALGVPKQPALQGEKK